MPSVEEILANSRQLLKGFSPTALKKTAEPEGFRLIGDIKYPRITRTMTVLTPVGYQWKDQTLEYFEQPNDLPLEYYGVGNITYVFHGHSREQRVCFAPDLCHVYGYKPQGNESPVFLKRWKEKWNE